MEFITASRPTAMERFREKAMSTTMVIAGMGKGVTILTVGPRG
jgi:hypothetical protein